MTNGAKFPPLVAFFDGADYWLADGFHRIQSERQLDYKESFVDVRQGTRRDAVLYSVGANSDHGLRRTNADKRRAVMCLLNDKEWTKWNSNRIARQCNVSHTMVDNLREASCNGCKIEKRLVSRNGVTYEQNTANIGRRKEEQEEPADAFDDYHEQMWEESDSVFKPGILDTNDGSFKVVSEEQILEEIPEEKILKAAKEIREEKAAIRREENEAARQAILSNPIKIPDGKYQTIVIDPPWDMKKIERDNRPEQYDFDYPTMKEEELKEFDLESFAADDCHLYLWTTHRFLPMALRLAEHWGFRYQCMLAWIKNVGMTPFSWMYSYEPILFCKRGSLELQVLGKRLDFNAKVRKHSRKPNEFYNLVREVSPGPRIDIFSREKRDGFDQFGNETDKFEEGSNEAMGE
jgi:N6-adenosine-specific RNA methylase IME4